MQPNQPHGQPQGQPQQPQQQPVQQQPMQQQHNQMQQPMQHQPNVAASGEQVLYEGVRKHSASWWDYTKWVLVIAFGSTAGAFLQRIEFFSQWPLYLIGLIGIPGIIFAYLKHITTKFKITNRRVEFERGVVSKDVDSLELWRVLDVRYNQNLVDRMLGNATITLIGTDQSDPELNMHGLPDHRALFEKVRDAVQAARSRGRPMEFVGQEGFGEEAGMF
ncbi:MAG: PH domain-containing protein [Myxococcota bacterium]